MFSGYALIGGNILWEDSVAENSEEISGHVKCTKQLALTVERNAKFHSSLQKASLFTAKNAI
jgi:hypothetical protein